MNRNFLIPGLFVTLMTLSFHLMAEVTTITANGFTSTNTVSVDADADTVYSAFKQVDKWWNPDHGYTGDAKNFYFEERLGGCFCERFPDGGAVEHLRIIYFAPGKEIRFEGALGPLQGLPTSGRMIWTIAPTEPGNDGPGSTITFTFHVFGFMEGGFEGLAPAVNGVVNEQLQRLAELLN
ncbi:MAG TPA: hypothetical protein VJ984_09650 [Xanthomonadales bacterium]|nr:hypothetical protein [Xanthomonadales bacterium]